MPVFSFGGFLLDTDAYRLTREGQPVAVSPRQLDLLAYLVERPSQLVTRDELFDALWPGTTVTDNALTQLVSDLRQALGDPPSASTYVQTVARRGYRFIAGVSLTGSRSGTTDREVLSAAHRSHETSSLDALRAATEGRLQLEALDGAEVEAAIANFERAVALDPSFAGGYVGLANARVWEYERRRFGYRPDRALLAAAVGDARRGVALAPEYAEAHATLAYVLTVSDRAEEARASARRAIALRPQFWGHHFRLGHASWGEERLVALRQCLQLYPAFPLAHFQISMVYVARQAFDSARRVLEEGVAVQRAMGEARSRFPASGLHWMLGSIALRQRDLQGALGAFERECDDARAGLYAREFSVAALNSRGFALVGAGRFDEAEEAFWRSLDAHEEQVRPHLGMVLVARHRSRKEQTSKALTAALDGIEHLRLGGRTLEADLMTAGVHVVEGQLEEAARALERLTDNAPPGPAGWALPIDPLFAPLVDRPSGRRLLQQLAVRAN